jgi:uncharacterized protein YecA (UPF0149 family)
MESNIYQVKIEMKHIKPLIWRRMKLPGCLTFGEIHSIIQKSMGWWDEHLHEFSIKKKIIDNSSRATLESFKLKKGDIVNYVYDFGDSWEVVIKIESVFPFSEEVFNINSICMDGKRACPPEDCGGVGGYYSLLEVLSDKNHPDHEKMVEWSEEFDPEEFDVKKINECLEDFFHDLLSGDDSEDYPLEEYLGDIDIDVLKEIVKKHPEIESFDFLHGMVSGYAVLDFSEIVLENIVATTIKRERYINEINTLLSATKRFIYSNEFVPHCKNWEYINYQENDPVEWCLGFVSILDLFMNVLQINEKKFFYYAEEDIFPFAVFASIGKDTEKIEKAAIKDGMTLDELKTEAFDVLPFCLSGIADVFEKILYDMEKEKKHISVVSNKIGRNDLCPCGSGKKYKKCCGKL